MTSADAKFVNLGSEKLVGQLFLLLVPKQVSVLDPRTHNVLTNKKILATVEI